MKNLVIEFYKLLFCRPSAQKFNQLLLQCAAHGLGVLNYRNLRDTGEEFLLKHYLPKALAGIKTPTLLDVGANTGSYSMLLRSNFPMANIHAFEPHPTTFKGLIGNLKDSRVSCVNKGLSNICEDSKIFERKGNETSEHNSLYKGALTKNPDEELQVRSIQLTSLDAYMKSEGVGEIHFLKIDTEGHELAVLKGAAKALKDSSIKLIQIEFNEMNLVSHSTMRDIRGMLPGFDFFRLSPRGLIKLPDLSLYQEIYQFQNILCVPKK
jgi:FkbM family methyltransferase